MKQISALLILFGWLSVLPAAVSAQAEVEEPLPPKPPTPEIKALRLQPESLELVNGTDVRGLLVSGQTEQGEWIDLTGEATLTAESDTISIDDEGYIHPRAVGESKVTVSAAGLEATVPVKVIDASLPRVRFVRDVMPLMARAGCNAGTCHGAAKGKNGFKLSLRGYDPAADYDALVNDLTGRRFNRADPRQSLMLLKPTADVPHKGGQVIVPDSPYYDLIRRWIAEGVRPETLAEGRAVRIEVLPKETELGLPGMQQQLFVMAHYADSTVRDVTREAIFSSSLGEVAKVSDGGLITGIRRGEAAVLVRYEGSYATQRVSVMGDRSEFVWSPPAENNFIDARINAKLKKMKILPSETCTDAEFIRRVSIDLTGLPPTPDEVRAFLADPVPEKRNRLIDSLIGSPDYVEQWTNKWADLLQSNSKNLGEKGVWLFREWIRDSIERNEPYDKFVRTLVSARGSTYSNPPANYFRVMREPNKATEDLTQVFLGVRFQCAKCHDHPFEQWTQNQYYEFSAYFARVGLKKGQRPGEEIVYTKYDAEEVKYPKTDMVIAASVPFGPAAPVEEGTRRVDALAAWLASEENPLFAQALVNRVWSYFFSRGIIEPVDDIRPSNPASNPELLDALSDYFVETGFDVRALMRTICQSRAYQRSIVSNRWNEDDTSNFSHAIPRRLSAEQLLDAIAAAADSRPKFEGLPANLRAVQLPDGMVKGDEFLALFGRPERQSACECERSSSVSLAHALNLINGPTVAESLIAPEGRLVRLASSNKDDRAVIEEIYLAVLSRHPTEQEYEVIDLAAAPSRLEGAQDLAWALLNSPAFLFNR